MANYFKYNGETFWFDETTKSRIDKAMEDYSKAMKSLKSLEDLGMELPRDYRRQLRFHLIGYMPSKNSREIIYYINLRMSEIEKELGIHDYVSKY